jgi:orotate phosphoribosyltransferase
MILVLDDLATSGVTMRRSLEAIRNAGVAAFGFAYNGC